MEAATGKQPAVELPKQLRNMLDVFLRDNLVHSWSVHSENIGSTIKIRLQPVAVIALSSKQPGTSQPLTQHVNTAPVLHFTKKTPCQLRRDKQRCNKRPRMLSSPESPRIADMSALMGHLDSPDIVSCERGENSLVVSPIMPIVLSFDNIDPLCAIHQGKVLETYHDDNLDIVEEQEDHDWTSLIPGMDVKCPNCDKVMESALHICDDVSTVTEENYDESSTEKVDECMPLTDIPKLVCAPRISRSNYVPDLTCQTYCVMAGYDKFDEVGHSSHMYYKCITCKAYVCHACIDMMSTFSYKSPCCHHYELDQMKYTSKLDPYECT